MNRKAYLVTGNPFKCLLIFVLPIMLGNLFQQCYNLADSAILGRFVSEQALAAAGACLSFCNIFIFIANGAGAGASVIVSRYYGANDFARMKLSITTAYITFIMLSVVLGIAGFAISPVVMSLLKTPSDTIGLAVTYLRIYFLGLPFLFLYNVTASMFNALGKSAFPLMFLIFSSILNIFLDLLFVIKFNSGIAGVAWATLIAQGVSCVISVSVFIVILRNVIGGKDSAKSSRQLFSGVELSNMTRIALPSIFQQVTISIGLMLVQSVVNSFGSQALAGFSLGLRVESLGSTLVVAIGVAFSTYTAQNIGAGKTERIHTGYVSANLIAIMFCSVFFVLIQIFKNSIISFFLGSDANPVTYATAIGYLNYMSCVLCIMGFKHTSDGVLRGMGRMKMFTIGNFVNIFIRVSFSHILAPIIGVQAVWISNPIGWSASLIMCYLSYRNIMKNRSIV